MKIAYNGGDFYGFQSQKNDFPTIAKKLEEVFASVGIFNKFIASGRTDKGVHANAQVISLELPSFFNDFHKLQSILNTKLYPCIKVKHIWEVNQDFNARFSAKKRGYCYLLSQTSSPFLNHFSLFHTIKNEHLIQEALNLLLGTHNFSAFMKLGSKNSSTLRTIYRAKLRKTKNFYIISICGNGFLRSQIRLIVGFLLEIDKGNLKVCDFKAQLLGKQIFKIPCPPQGLFLSKVSF